jgi:hypothetical protein
MRSWAMIAVTTASLGSTLALAPPVSAQAQAECRVEEMDPRRGPARQTFCLGPDGQWRARPDLDAATASGRAPADRGAPGGPAAASLPPDWRGTITYSGTHEGYVQQAGPEMRELSISSVVGAVAGGQRQRQRYAGRYDMVLTIDGTAVTGQASGTGGIEPATFSGTRTGNLCRLYIEGAELEATCTTERFVGASRSPRGASPSFLMNIDARATRVVDTAEEERQRAMQRSRAAPPPAARREYSSTDARELYDLAGSCTIRFQLELGFSPELEPELTAANSKLMSFTIFAGQEAGLSDDQIPTLFYRNAPTVEDRFRDRQAWDQGLGVCRELAHTLST